MRSYEEFKDYVYVNIKESLPTKFADYDMSFRTIVKAGREYEGLIISKKDDSPIVTATPVINMNQFYDKYLENGDIDTILEEMAYTRTDSHMDVGKFNSFEAVKSKIYMRLINTEANKEYLRDKLATPMEDLSIIYTLRFDAQPGTMAEAAVTKDLLDYWGVTESDVITAARLNVNSEEYIFKSLFSMIFGVEDESEDGIYFLSNKYKVNGAYAAINHRAMNEIYDEIGPFYVLPSSIHEVLIVSRNGSVGPTDAIHMLRTVNNQELDSNEVLSNNIYLYDFGRKKLVIADIND